jgi:hypothetical protein
MARRLDAIIAALFAAVLLDPKAWQQLGIVAIVLTGMALWFLNSRYRRNRPLISANVAAAWISTGSTKRSGVQLRNSLQDGEKHLFHQFLAEFAISEAIIRAALENGQLTVSGRKLSAETIDFQVIPQDLLAQGIRLDCWEERLYTLEDQPTIYQDLHFRPAEIKRLISIRRRLVRPPWVI